MESIDFSLKFCHTIHKKQLGNSTGPALFSAVLCLGSFSKNGGGKFYDATH